MDLVEKHGDQNQIIGADLYENKAYGLPLSSMRNPFILVSISFNFPPKFSKRDIYFTQHPINGRQTVPWKCEAFLPWTPDSLSSHNIFPPIPRYCYSPITWLLLGIVHE